MIASKNAIHSATVTTNTLATPEGVYCSAQTTNELPLVRSRTPTIASTRQSAARRGKWSPSASATAASRPPAIMKRSPANRNGGSTPTPIRMAR